MRVTRISQLVPRTRGTRNPTENLSITLNSAGLSHISELESRLKQFEPQAEEFFKRLYGVWDAVTKEKPNKPLKLGIDSANLARLVVVATAAQPVAEKILEQVPFGPSLNKAMQLALSNVPVQATSSASQHSSADSGASLGDILGAALKARDLEVKAK